MVHMFSVYCSWHGADVLLGPNDIDAMFKDGNAFFVRWHCTCGNTGVDRVGGSAHDRQLDRVEATAC
jgi:hypothetical protein